MRIATVIGQVTLNQCHPSFEQASLRLVVPMQLDEAQGKQLDTTELLVAWDEFGAGNRSKVAMSEGPEASRPFRPQLKPVDTYIAALLDELHWSPQYGGAESP